MGTGFQAPHDPIGFEKTMNRTYLVATVWGYNRGADASKMKTPGVSLACLSSCSKNASPPGNGTTTTTTTGATATTATSAHSSSLVSITKSSVSSQTSTNAAKRYAAVNLPFF